MIVFYGILFVVVAILIPFLIFDWYGHYVFMYTAYPRRYGHGKSGMRAKKHYKTHWKLYERILWIHAFKEPYEKLYMGMVYLSYIHFILAIITAACFIISNVLFPNASFWVVVYVIYVIFTFVRYIHDNTIARE